MAYVCFEEFYDGVDILVDSRENIIIREGVFEDMSRLITGDSVVTVRGTTEEVAAKIEAARGPNPIELLAERVRALETWLSCEPWRHGE